MRCFLVCYDIRDAKRWRRVFRIMKTYGEPWQYSVFFCRLRTVDRTRMEAELRRAIHHEEDRVLLCDLGNDGEGALGAITGLGRQKLALERIAVF